MLVVPTIGLSFDFDFAAGRLGTAIGVAAFELASAVVFPPVAA
jgi:hypothetical protein